MVLQAHCHLALTLGITPEFAPIYKWRATLAMPTPVIMATLHTGITGKMSPFLLQSGGSPVRQTLWSLRLVIEAEESMTVQQRQAALITMYGQKVYFVQHDHAANGANHTSDVKTAYFEQLGEFEPLSQGNYSRLYVDIQLREGTFLP